jgi:phage shock protein E
MFDVIKKLFGIEKTDYLQLMSDGAIILDVRSSSEFNLGHIKGSVNIPVDKLAANYNKLKTKNKAIITCCASGARSAAAKGILKSKGFTNVHNGGAWYSLERKIN